MTADPFFPGTQDPEDPKPLRAFAVTTFLMLVTAFLYQSMDGVQRADEQAERREHLARAACRASVMEEYADAPDEESASPPASTAPAPAEADANPPADPSVP